MSFLANSPQGFTDAVSMLNALPQGLLAEMCQDVVAFLQYQVGFINASEHEMSISRLRTTSVRINAQVCINALTFIFRSAASSKLSSEDFTTELKSSLLFQKECLAVLREVWQNEGPALLALPKTALSVGELISMDWKLGVAMSSSGCRSLNAPYVSLQLKVGESQYQTKVYNIEMSLAEFQNFATQLQEISKALETV